MKSPVTTARSARTHWPYRTGADSVGLSNWVSLPPPERGSPLSSSRVDMPMSCVPISPSSTGDFITGASDPWARCIGNRNLRAPLGVFACTAITKFMPLPKTAAELPLRASWHDSFSTKMFSSLPARPLIFSASITTRAHRGVNACRCYPSSRHFRRDMPIFALRHNPNTFNRAA